MPLLVHLKSNSVTLHLSIKSTYYILVSSGLTSHLLMKKMEISREPGVLYGKDN